MVSLIISIIGLILIGIAVIMGTYYGGQAFQNGQINAAANAIMNEAQQILQAERLWSTLNNQPDISGMGNAGTNGTGISALVNGGELAEWPSFGGTIGYSTILTNPGPQPNTGNVKTGVADLGCYNIGGYYGYFGRGLMAYNNGNYVIYFLLQTLRPPCLVLTLLPGLLHPQATQSYKLQRLLIKP